MSYHIWSHIYSNSNSLIVQVHQYQIVGRAAPTKKNAAPKIYRMKLFSKNAVLAKSKFWYFMRKINKAKKTGGEILDCKEVLEMKPGTVKNFAVWLRYDSRTGTHNMYKEYRDVTQNGAISQMCKLSTTPIYFLSPTPILYFHHHFIFYIFNSNFHHQIPRWLDGIVPSTAPFKSCASPPSLMHCANVLTLHNSSKQILSSLLFRRCLLDLSASARHSLQTDQLPSSSNPV